MESAVGGNVTQPQLSQTPPPQSPTVGISAPPMQQYAPVQNPYSAPPPMSTPVSRYLIFII